MSNVYPGLYASPFHVRTAESNIYNEWIGRGIFTLPRHFGDAAREAIAPRFSVALADLTSFGKLRIYGAGAARLLSASCKSDMNTLASGQAREIYWTNDGGGVRGNGTVARFGEENFVLESFDTDTQWFSGVAERFDAKVRNEHAEKSGLLLAGPLATKILSEAELGAASTLGPQHHEIYDWNGISVTISRRARLGGFEMSCIREDAVVLFDRLTEAGRPHALSLIGQEALELLCLETGLLLSGLDYMPARNIGNRDPSANVLIGVEWDGAEPASCAPLFSNGLEVGRTLRSAYSPTLQRVIALATVRSDCATLGMSLSLGQSGQINSESTSARIVSLPFLPTK
jgi:glycine cleavage system aminomethyltransferase T